MKIGYTGSQLHIVDYVNDNHYNLSKEEALAFLRALKTSLNSMEQQQNFAAGDLSVTMYTTDDKIVLVERTGKNEPVKETYFDLFPGRMKMLLEISSVIRTLEYETDPADTVSNGLVVYYSDDVLHFDSNSEGTSTTKNDFVLDITKEQSIQILNKILHCLGKCPINDVYDVGNYGIAVHTYIRNDTGAAYLRLKVIRLNDIGNNIEMGEFVYSHYGMGRTLVDGLEKYVQRLTIADSNGVPIKHLSVVYDSGLEFRSYEDSENKYNVERILGLTRYDSIEVVKALIEALDRKPNASKVVVGGYTIKANLSPEKGSLTILSIMISQQMGNINKCIFTGSFRCEDGFIRL